MSRHWPWLLRAVLFCAALGFAPAGAAGPPLRMDRAEFADTEGGPWQAVSLPDTWRARGLQRQGLGHYRLRFELQAAPTGSWVLQVPRLANRHLLRLNGALVHGTLEGDGSVRRPLPLQLTLPPSLLRAGMNQIDITADHGPRAGLSALEIGPAGSAGAWPGPHWQTTLSQVLNVAGASIALFMLLLWWQRRSEVALGSFAALGLLASVRNQAYVSLGGLLPAPLSDWLYFVAQVASAVLLGLFAMASAGRTLPRYRQALLATAGVLPLLAAAAVWSGHTHRARTWLYPWLLLLVLPGLALLLRQALQRRSTAERIFAGGLALVVGVGLHDYLVQQGRSSIMDVYWMPYALPPLIAVFAAVLLRRLVAALDGVERANVTLEARVLERTRALQAANLANSRFIASASHDLRQPMVSIGLLVGLLREQVHGPVLGLVQRLQQATQAMEGLLKRLLDLSRLESGTVQVLARAVPLQALFDGIHTHHADQALRKGLRLVLRPTTAHVQSDPALLEQILRNLVGNAIRYASSGGVLVAARAAGIGHWRIEVWDTGPGIPQAQQQAIFEEFVRLPGSPAAGADADAGLGLGLSIVQRAVALLGVPVSLHSRVGRGSCFGIRLPAAAAPAARPQAPVAAAHPPDQPLAGLHLLLVEDDAGAREALVLRLTRWGARVSACASVLAAGRALDAGAAPPDLLITDQRLPDGRGSALVDRLHRRWPGAAALLVSGDTAPADLVQLARWVQAGVPVLHKPFDAQALLAAVHQALQRARPAGAVASEAQA